LAKLTFASWNKLVSHTVIVLRCTQNTVCFHQKGQSVNAVQRSAYCLLWGSHTWHGEAQWTGSTQSNHYAKLCHVLPQRVAQSHTNGTPMSVLLEITTVSCLWAKYICTLWSFVTCQSCNSRLSVTNMTALSASNLTAHLYRNLSVNNTPCLFIYLFSII
jgi:hypothetical protein